jgi:hypothetical protein
MAKPEPAAVLLMKVPRKGPCRRNEWRCRADAAAPSGGDKFSDREGLRKARSKSWSFRVRYQFMQGGAVPRRAPRRVAKSDTITFMYRMLVYAGDSPPRKTRLEGGGVEVHPVLQKPYPIEPAEFDVPPQVTAKGERDLAWHREPGPGGNGRSNQAAKVWLIK